MSNSKSGRDGSQFDMRDSELKKMGDFYIKIHQGYRITLNKPVWNNVQAWLNDMRVFQSYLEGYVSGNKEELAEKTRDLIVDMDETIEEKRELEEGRGVGKEIIEELEDIKSNLEVLRDAAGFTLPMNKKHDPDTAMGDQL